MKAALLIVDVQRYYIDATSSFCTYSEQKWPGSTQYLRDRVNKLVFPSVLKLRRAFDAASWPIIYLRLCGTKEDRSDLHRFFRKFWSDAEESGFKDAYPLAQDPWASVSDKIKPRQTDMVFNKTGFSEIGRASCRERV